VPLSPEAVTASGGQESATIAWSPPAKNGGKTIQDYTVTAEDVSSPSNGGQTCTWSFGSLSCSIDGLTAGDSYTFTVVASNAIGSGPSSAPSNAVTPSAPPPPAPAAQDLVVCVNSQYFALSPYSNSTIEPLLSAPQSDALIDDSCGDLSSNLQYIAATQTESDGSTDAGIVNVSSGAFTDLSGVANDNYAGNTVTDEDPVFAPRTDDLWWSVEQTNYTTLSYASLAGGGPVSTDYNGPILGFTPAGGATPLQVSASPSGSVLAAFGDDQFAVGSPPILSARCLQNADYEFDEFTVNTSCPGSAIGDVYGMNQNGTVSNCGEECTFVGLVSPRRLL
jgi:hypothetical protein